MVNDMQKHLDCLKTVIEKLPDQGWEGEKAGLSALLSELETRKSMEEVFVEGFDVGFGDVGGFLNPFAEFFVVVLLGGIGKVVLGNIEKGEHFFV